MSKIKKIYSPTFKLKVVLKYLSNDCTISELCQEFSVSKQTINNWVSQLKLSANLVYDSKSKNNNKKEPRAKKLKEKN